jgi:hypothetical protein
MRAGIRLGVALAMMVMGQALPASAQQAIQASRHAGKLQEAHQGRR